LTERNPVCGKKKKEKGGGVDQKTGGSSFVSLSRGRPPEGVLKWATEA